MPCKAGFFRCYLKLHEPLFALVIQSQSLRWATGIWLFFTPQATTVWERNQLMLTVDIYITDYSEKLSEWDLRHAHSRALAIEAAFVSGC